MRTFIQCYMEGNGRQDTIVGENTLFPNGYSGIFFNFGNRGKMTLKTNFEAPRVSIFGQIDKHFTVQHSPGFYSLGVLLKPTVLSRLLGINMGEITNMAIDGTLIRDDFRSLYNRLEECVSVSSKIRLIEEFIAAILVRTHHHPMLVDHALELLRQPMFNPIQNVAKELQVSERYLEMKFRAAVGLTPKTYSLIVRFKRIECQLRNASTVRWQDLSFAHEYFDQNHFIKDFKRFTGNTPSDYLVRDFKMGRTYLGA